MSFLQRWFRRGDAEQEMSDELRDHIERQTDANIAAGMPRDEARRQAMLQFGGSRSRERRLPRAEQRLLARDALQRRALRHSHDGALARIHDHRDSHAGAGHRREHRDIFRRERRAAQPAAVPAARATRLAEREQAKFRHRLDFLSQFSRLAAQQPHIFLDGDLALDFLQPYGIRRSRAVESGITLL